VDEANLLNKGPMVTNVNELILALSIQGLALHSHPGHDCILDLLWHKLLMLMIRISDFYFIHKHLYFYYMVGLALEACCRSP
jgi:hypothetical protein